ncbi:MAG: hypothetical protein U0031_03415 [Thermomicrobiales bacterium]
MDGARFDTLTRTLLGSRSRRQAIGLALATLLGGAGELAAKHGNGGKDRHDRHDRHERRRRRRHRDRPTPRRNGCQVRCGGEKRMCRIRCRRFGIFARDCKDGCKIRRKACHNRCTFHPVRSRF